MRKPILLMGCCNPFRAYGFEQLVRDACRAGVNGFMIPDLPLDESQLWDAILAKSALDKVSYVVAATTQRRLATICSRTSGFLYCIASSGLTGQGLAPDLEAFLARVRCATDVPVAVGYGISTPDQVRRVTPFADGVVVGSALVEAVLLAPAGKMIHRLSELVYRLADATARPGNTSAH
jgi:tryptophan synthase alpha subunit